MPFRATIRITKSLIPPTAEVGYVIGKLVVSNANSIRRGGPFFKLKSVIGPGSVAISEKGIVSLTYLDPEASGAFITMTVSATGVSPVPYDEVIPLSISFGKIDIDVSDGPPVDLYLNVLYWKGEPLLFKNDILTLN